MNSLLLRRAFIRNGAFRSSIAGSTSQRVSTLLCFENRRESNDFCFSSPVHPNVPPASPLAFRCFSSEANVVDDLVALLDREHKEEIEKDCAPVGWKIFIGEELHNLEEILTSSGGWKIASDDNSSITKLYKTIDSVKVHVSFRCQDGTERLAEEEEEEEFEGQNQVESARFTASVTKGGKTLFIVCIAQDAMTYIQNVAFAGAVQDIDALHANGLNQSLYQGPEFKELAEDLQKAFYAYVEDYLGINNDIATYISLQFDYKERNLYIKFLEETKSLLA